MNISIQCCGLAVMICLFFFYFRQKKVGLYTENIFLWSLGVSMVCIVLDIAVAFTAISFGEGSADSVFLLALLRVYGIGMICVTYFGMVYALTDLFNEAEYKKTVRRIGVIALLEAVIILFLPSGVAFENGHPYVIGFGATATYIFALAFVVATIYYVIRYGKLISRRRRVAVISWMSLWFLAAVIQLFVHSIQLVGFACALGMMTLFFTLENPQSNIDRQFGCFHSHAMMAYLNQCFERKVPLSILLISMSGYQVEGMENETINNSLLELILFMENRKGVRVFKSVEQELIVIFEDPTEMTLLFQQIQDTYYVDQYYQYDENNELTVFPRTLFVLIPNSLILEDAKEILRLYQHIKAENRDNNNSQVCYVDQEILDRLRERENIRQTIIHAIREDRVEVFFQPIYSTVEKRFVTAEALVRIRDKDGGFISPGRFITVAEDSGMILKLGERIFEKTCQFVAEYDIESLGMRYVEVNLSVIQCERRDLADRFISIMQKYKVDPWLINLEITETGSVQSKMYLMKNMKKLIDYGVSFSLDDFGNGQSNLDYMIDMPISIVKLDMNMTAVYFKDLKARFVVLATIRMAHEMDLMIVAEGIETEEQLKEMEDQGIDFIQGYYFSKPLPQEKFIEFIRNHHK